MVRVVEAQRGKLRTASQEEMRESCLECITFSKCFRIFIKKGFNGYNLVKRVGQGSWLEDAVV